MSEYRFTRIMMAYDTDDLFDIPPEPQLERVYTVSELTFEIKDLLEGEYASVIVEGEISGWKIYSSGHAYFSLKDEEALISGVMWRTSLIRHRSLEIRDGMAVRAEGRISLYPPRGQYQLVVETLKPAGEGLLQKRFEELKKRLAAEGLFDPERKQPLPFLPRCIGIVTSSEGAAIKDFLKIVREAHLPLELVLASCRVQGVEAPGEIAAAIAQLNSLPRIDTIIVTRGGGSLEDLWAFNEEIVARAIAESLIPVMSAVGHEIDITIADLVADVRAPTPSGAALILSDIYEEQRNQLKHLSAILIRNKAKHLEAIRSHLTTLYRGLSRYHPRRVLDERRRRLDDISDSLYYFLQYKVERERSHLEHQSHGLCQLMTTRVTQVRNHLNRMADRLSHQGWHHLQQKRSRWEKFSATLHELDPQRILTRGFAIVEKAESGEIVKRSRILTVGESLRIRFCDGKISSRVESIDTDKV